MSMVNREVLLDDLKLLLSQHVVGFDAIFARCTTVDAALICVGEQVFTYKKSQEKCSRTHFIFVFTHRMLSCFLSMSVNIPYIPIANIIVQMSLHFL